MMTSKRTAANRQADGNSPRRFRITPMILLFVFVEVVCVYDLVATNVWPYGHWLSETVSTLVAGRPVPPNHNGPIDYRVFWSVGHLASEHDAGLVYDQRALERFEVKRESYAPNSPWMYPPPTIVPTYLTRLGSYGANFLIWTFILNALAVLILRSVDLPWAVVLAALVSPAALWSDALGQFSLVAGALLIASLMAASQRPARAGLFAGLLTMKPQIGLLLPVVFLAKRDIRAIIAALVTLVLLVAVSLLMFGESVWTDFFTKGLATAGAYQHALTTNLGIYSGVSIFWFARLSGLGIPASNALQAISAFGAVIWCWTAWRDPAAASLPRIALTACLAAFVTPHLFVDGLCAYSVGILLLAWDRGELRLVDVLLWAGPLIASNVTVMTHVLAPPLIILLAALYAYRQMRRNVGEPSADHPAALEST